MPALRQLSTPFTRATTAFRPSHSFRMSHHPPFKQTEASRPPFNKEKETVISQTPRPIAFVSSINAEGVTNLAPFSYFNIVSHNPPTIVISFSHSKPPARKETAANILETKTFTVNIISEAFVEAANVTSIDAPPEVSEWAISEHSHDLHNDAGENTATLIVGRIKLFHIRDDVYNAENSTIELAKLKPISRLGGITYGRTTETFELPRPSWSAEKDSEAMQAALEKGKAASKVPMP
ncbi:hypothetical protein RQP46_009399 [Phenoliferia psychrophenolica]